MGCPGQQVSEPPSPPLRSLVAGVLLAWGPGQQAKRPGKPRPRGPIRSTSVPVACRRDQLASGREGAGLLGLMTPASFSFCFPAS